ncbi:type II secretion system F family protein [Kitasatospora sp. NPDC002040]|uniref:type II secretion system F family protein n=1 Tax=Kitasatospora sp. NPDC002040 TaxID=3154661 RepID=UPI00332D12B0
MTPDQVLLGAAGAGGLVAGLLLRRRQRARTVRRARALLDATARESARGGRWAAFGRARPAWLVPELLLLPAGLLAGRLSSSPVPLLVAALAVLPVRRWRSRRRRAAEAGRRAVAVIELCTGLAAELRSGATAQQALHTVLGRASVLTAGLGAESSARLAAGRYGADIPAALRTVAELPGGRGAAAVAACWQVTAESGTGLAPGLDQLADALRAERALAEEIEGELAGPRTTVAVLAALPLIGLLLGAALGAEPVRILLHTPAGLACLAAGALLEAAGLAWTARIVRAAEDAPEPRPEPRPELRPESRAGAARRAGGCGLSRVRAGVPPQDRWVGSGSSAVRAEVAW